MAENTKSEPVKAKLLALVETVQFAWFIGHIATLFFALLYYVLPSTSSVCRASYRLAYVGCLESFGIILYQSYKSSKPDVYTLLADSNFQYTFEALLWLCAPRNLLLLVPFAVFSTFHVLGYLKNVLLPAVGANKALSARFSSFIAGNNGRLLVFVANVEFVLLLHVLLRALFFRKRAWIVLVVYGFFMKLRFDRSPYTRGVFKEYEVRLDGIFADPRMWGGEWWERIKGIKRA